MACSGHGAARGAAAGGYGTGDQRPAICRMPAESPDGGRPARSIAHGASTSGRQCGEEYMTFRISLASTLAAALVIGTVSTASAQSDTTRKTTSQRRVRVTKEATGEVTPRRDSTAIRDSVARADSLARMETMRRDSVTRDSTARADSIARASAATTTTTTASDTIRSPISPT